MDTAKCLLILLLLLPGPGCSTTQSHQAGPANNEISETSPASVNKSQDTGSSGIRGIDFNDFTYDWYPAWADTPPNGRKIVLVDGKMDLDFSYGKEPREFFIIQDGITYGDLTGDNKDEAVVVMKVIGSGTARPNLIFVYTLSNKLPFLLWTYETGDRWDYGYHKVSVTGNRLLVERYKPQIIEYEGQKHNMSQSDSYIRDYYKWDGRNFTRVKTEEIPADPNDKSPWVTHSNKPQL